MYTKGTGPINGEQLNCEREDENPRDRYAVAIKRSGNIIAQVPQSAHKTAVTSLLASYIAVLLSCWFNEPEGLGSSRPRFSILKYLANSIILIVI